MAACCHHLRRQRPVQLRIPLRGKAWLDSRKIVKAGKHFLVCTIRAFRLVTDSVRNGRTEGMSLFAAPPYAAVGRGRYRIRRAVGIFLPIPFVPQFPETLSAGRFRPSERPFRRKSGSRCRRLSGKRYWFCSCVRLDISTRRGARFPAAPAPVSAAHSVHPIVPAALYFPYGRSGHRTILTRGLIPFRWSRKLIFRITGSGESRRRPAVRPYPGTHESPPDYLRPIPDSSQRFPSTFG